MLITTPSDSVLRVPSLETDRSDCLSCPPAERIDSRDIRSSTSKGLGIGSEVRPIQSALGIILSSIFESSTLTEYAWLFDLECRIKKSQLK